MISACHHAVAAFIPVSPDALLLQLVLDSANACLRSLDAGEVKEFGFREIGDDEPHTTHFAGNDEVQQEPGQETEEETARLGEAPATEQQGPAIGKPTPAGASAQADPRSAPLRAAGCYSTC